MRTHLLRFALASWLLAGPPRHAAAADSAEAVHLLPSQVSELRYAYDSLRRAAASGDLAAYRQMYDPATLRETYEAPNGGTERLTAEWLRAHATEWPSLGSWEVAEARGYGAWARLTLRQAHRVAKQPDGRWDFYFLHFRKVEGYWRLTRRAIATFPGAPGGPPPVHTLALVSLFELPPRPLDSAPLPPAE